MILAFLGFLILAWEHRKKPDDRAMWGVDDRLGFWLVVLGTACQLGGQVPIVSAVMG